MRIRAHTCAGGDWGSTHRADRADTSTPRDAAGAKIRSRVGSALAARELGL
jgi:hypothetical protein